MTLLTHRTFRAELLSAMSDIAARMDRPSDVDGVSYDYGVSRQIIRLASELPEKGPLKAVTVWRLCEQYEHIRPAYGSISVIGDPARVLVPWEDIRRQLLQLLGGDPRLLADILVRADTGRVCIGILRQAMEAWAIY